MTDNTDSLDMRPFVREVMRDLRERPARRMILLGGILTGISGMVSIVMLALALHGHGDPTIERISLAICMAGVICLMGGVLLRAIRNGQDRLQREIRRGRGGRRATASPQGRSDQELLDMAEWYNLGAEVERRKQHPDPN